MTFQAGDHIQGFTVTRVRELAEIRSTLIEMKHDRSGAQLCWCRSDEPNKLFCVTFKTLPEDATGVFHILEHSVLCGSEKFPVREPFVELIKGSMNTFLNAITFNDKTMYPVSSRNKQDFLNLTEVYLDAVFAPAILTNPCIFMQEGWHVETEGRGQPASLKGVVFNEMKGAMSSVDEVMEETAATVLFPDTCYGFNSGGDPRAIPDLTYEAFIDTYKRFYHPDNARIWLDGDIPVEETFALIERYLSRFTDTGRRIEDRWQGPIPARHVEEGYAIAPDEDPTDKTHILFTRIMHGWADKTRGMAVSVLLDAVAGGNDAPFKRAILDAGLGQDINIALQDGILQSCAAVWVRNTSAEKLDAIREVLRKTAEDLIARGVDRQELEASINRLAFRLKEPTEPQGLVRAIMACNAWLYDGDPAMYLVYDDTLAELRAMLQTDGYEQLLRDIFLRPEDTHEIILSPDPAMGERLRAEEQARLDARLSGMDDAAFDALLAANRRLNDWQQTPDSPEARASLPALTLDEVNPEPAPTHTVEESADGVTVLWHDAPCPGIAHVNMYYRVGEYTAGELTDLSLLPDLLGELPTARHTVTELQRDIKLYTGALDIALEIMAKDEDPDHFAVYLNASFSALKENAGRASGLLREILLETDFSSDQLIREILLQTDDDLRQSVIMSGNRFAAMRTGAHYSAAAAASEVMNGITLVRRSHEICADLPAAIAPLRDFWQRALRETVCRSRLILSVTGERLDAGVLLAGLPEGTPCAAQRTLGYDAPMKEGFVVPAQINYAAMGWSLSKGKTPFDATANVLSHALSFAYLWNTVRVQGGAYGVSFSIRPHGAVTAASYRDPNPAHTLAAYRAMPDFVRSFVDSGEPLTPFIIATIGQGEPLLTPRQQGKVADLRWFKGITDAQRRADREQMLRMTPADLSRWLDALQALASDGAVCVVGPSEAVEKADEGLTIVSLA